MPLKFRAVLRPLALASLTLSAFCLSAPASHAAPTVPTIDSVSSSVNPLLAVGGVVTVTAHVTASASGLSTVILYETYDNSNNTYRTAPMVVGADGVTYTASIPVDQNTNSNANGERLFVEVKDKAGNVVDATAITQGYDNIPPVFVSNSIVFGPDPVPVQGANVTVTAKVTDSGLGLSSVILYETYDNSSNTYRTAPMAVGTDGVTYTATVPVDPNSNTGANGERLYIEAKDKAGNATDYAVTTQGYSSVPASGSLPVLVTADGSTPVLSPASVGVGNASVLLTVRGINFAAGATVLFNGVQLPTSLQTDRLLTVSVPPSLLAQAGSFPVTVVDPSPSGASNSVNFIVKASAASTTHVMWTNTNGQLSLWNYDPLSGGFSQLAYGPYAGWSAKAVADGPDGKTRVIWMNTSGQVSLWNLDNTTGVFSQHTFGPFSGWSASAISVSP